MKLAGDVLEKAQDLLDAGCTPMEVSRQTSVPKSTVYRGIEFEKLEIHEDIVFYEDAPVYHVSDGYHYEMLLSDIINEAIVDGRTEVGRMGDECRELGMHILETHGGIKRFLGENGFLPLADSILFYCKTCGNNKNVLDFYPSETESFGIRGMCGACESKGSALRAKLSKTDNKQDIKLRALRRRARVVDLPYDFDADVMEGIFGKECVLTGSGEVDIDHFIPISWGYGGTINGNMYPLHPSLNRSKSNKNPFKWFDRAEVERGLDRAKFNKLVDKLAELNGMESEEYRDYVEWCDENRKPLIMAINKT